MRQVDKSLAELAFQADSGDADAQYCVGLVFLLGESVDQDFVAAYHWMARASAGGHIGAKSLAARLLQVRPGVEEQVSLPNQVLAKATSVSTTSILLTRQVFQAIQERTSTLLAKQFPRFAPRMRLKAGAKFPDFPAPQTEGFEFSEVS